jgi:putative lipoic acid-binding regulatory protein
MPSLCNERVLGECLFAMYGKASQALIGKDLQHHHSFLPMVCRPARPRPNMRTNILVWTSLMTGPRDSFGLSILGQAFPTIPDTVFEIISNFMKDDNVLFMRQCGVRRFRVDDERIGNFEFATLIVPTTSREMMAEIHDDLLAVGIPCTAARMSQFTTDLLMIIGDRFGFRTVVKIYGWPPDCVLVIAPEED